MWLINKTLILFISILLLIFPVQNLTATNNPIVYNNIKNKHPIMENVENVIFRRLSNHQKKELECLIDNIWFEAGTEPESGKIAVAMVTLNRVFHNKFPDSICAVVNEKRGNVCQFSWKCEQKHTNKTAKKVLTNGNEMMYNNIRRIALNVFMHHSIIHDVTRGAIFYHADYVKPRWKNVKFTTKIGRHIFYKGVCNGNSTTCN